MCGVVLFEVPRCALLPPPPARRRSRARGARPVRPRAFRRRRLRARRARAGPRAVPARAGDRGHARRSAEARRGARAGARAARLDARRPAPRRNRAARLERRGHAERAAHHGEERMSEDRVWGRNPVLELLRGGGRRVDEVAVLAGGRGPLTEVVALARRVGVKVSYRTREQLAAIAGTDRHQGVVARVAAGDYFELDALLETPRARQ